MTTRNGPTKIYANLKYVTGSLTTLIFDDPILSLYSIYF